MKHLLFSHGKKTGLALCIGILLHSAVVAQVNSRMLTRTYDTTLVSNGYGVYSLSFPQFNPDSGTLVSVKISALTNSQYTFTLKNDDTVSSTDSLVVGQEDMFRGSALPSTFTNLYAQTIGTFLLQPNQGVTEGPFPFLSGYVASDSVVSVAGFMGGGNVALSYTSYTYTNLTSYNNRAYYYSATIANSMKVSLQYLYSQTQTVLASQLVSWNVTPILPRTAILNWSVTSEKGDRTYAVQRSTDGKNFTTIATLPAVVNGSLSNYSYADSPVVGTPSVVYYRLEIDGSSPTTWSSVKEVLLGLVENEGGRVYPVPAESYINLSTGRTGNWQTDVVAASGALIQRDIWRRTSLCAIQFRSRLAAGTYFIRAVDTNTGKQMVESFVVTK